MHPRTTKRRTAILADGLALALGTATLAEAGPRHLRARHHRARIHQGVESGALTPVERKALDAEHAAIREAREMMLEDGTLSPAERRKLDAMQDRANRHIRRLKHNDREADRGGHEGRG